MRPMALSAAPPSVLRHGAPFLTWEVEGDTMIEDLLIEGFGMENQLRRAEAGFVDTETLIEMCHEAANILLAYRLEVVLLRARAR